MGRRRGGRLFCGAEYFATEGEIFCDDHEFFRLSDQADWSAVQARGIFGVDF